MSRKLRCLQIGVGGMANSYLRHFYQEFADRMEVVAIVDIRKDVLQSQGDFLGLPSSRRFTNMEEAFRQIDADFCTIVIPPAFHKEAVMHAVESGMAILSEKPIADTWEDCIEIYRAVTKAGVRMQVVQNYRYTPRILTMKKALQSGDLGVIRYVIARFAADYRVRGSWGAFRHDIPHTLLVEGAVHHFDQIRNLTNADCQWITGFEWKPEQDSFDGECCALFAMEMTNDSHAAYEGSCLGAGWQNSWHREYYRVECENGAIVLDRDNIVRVMRHDPAEGLKTQEIADERPRYQGHVAIIDQFLTWMEGGPEPKTILQDNIQSAGMLFGAMEASAKRTAVNVQEKIAAITKTP